MKLLLQTARPITLLAWIPPFVGSLLGSDVGWHTLTACFGTMMAVGLVNTHNNQTDRKIDRHNSTKQTLAVQYPLQNHQVLMVGGSLLAVFLRQTGYCYLLLSILYYLGIFYNYFLGRVPIVKRIMVAAIVAGTAFLAVDSPNSSVWIWAMAVAAFINYRESGKDRADAQEDTMFRFFRRGARVDPWCVIAPFAGVGIYLASTLVIGVVPTSTHLVISLGMALAIFSFMQIRARHGWYKMRFPHRLIAGQSGLILALAALMPPFAERILPVVVFNVGTIYVRSCLPARANVAWWANAHDAYLWSSLVWLAMLGPGVFSLAAALLSVLVFLTIFVWEFYRTRPLWAT